MEISEHLFARNSDTDMPGTCSSTYCCYVKTIFWNYFSFSLGLIFYVVSGLFSEAEANVNVY